MHQDALLCIVQNDKFTLRVLGITMKEKDDHALKGYARLYITLQTCTCYQEWLCMLGKAWSCTR